LIGVAIAAKACKVSVMVRARRGEAGCPMKSKTKKKTETAKIAYQGEPGANSHIACLNFAPAYEPLACATFEDALAAVRSGTARYALIPVENSVAGRVADVHHLLPNSGLHIAGEHFERIYHQLIAPQGATLNTIKTVHSHTHALGQCRTVIRALGLTPVVEADTAGAAAMVASGGDVTKAAIASKLAAEIYGLTILKTDIEDAEHNTTRFLLLSAVPETAPAGNGPVLTTFIFRVKNIPAALYKALGGFATNGVNMTKLESYQLEGSFNASMFYADVEGHPEDRPLKLALEELVFHSAELIVLGTYPASSFRLELKQRNGEVAAAQ
jgi:prephenate dehydratase